ncbi:MAG TPA: hypothetical protein PLW48_00120 [Alphaproteobacteria bacterium]|nr:hypothetical protein [Alphaproteobacteria bacterium]
MNTSNFTASFRVFHPIKPPDDILQAIQLPACIINSVGAPRQTPKGTPLEGTYSRTMVVFDLPPANSASLSAFLQAMIKEPFANSPHIKELVSTGGEARFFISIFCTDSYGASLEPSLLMALGAKQLGLDLTVYPEET